MDNLSRILAAGEAIHRTLEIDRRIFIILTCVTAGCVFGFSRAFLLLKNEKTGVFKAKMGVGPTSQEDANRIWCQMSQENESLEKILAHHDNRIDKKSLPLYSLVERMNVHLAKENELIAECTTKRQIFRVTKDSGKPRMSDEFLSILGTDEFVCVPLLVEDSIGGALLADNLYSGHPISQESIQQLKLFANQMGTAIAEARLHQKLLEDQKRLRKMETELRHLYVLASVGEASAYLVHEIRNPLVIIGGFARSIRKHMNDSELLKKRVDTIIEEVERLEALLRETLDYAGSREPLFQLKDPNATIDVVCELMKLELTEPTVSLLKDLHPVPRLRIDEDQLKQVILNLIQNAVESMPQGGKLRVSTQQEENFVRIEIADTGIGFSSEIKDKIFTPFFTTKTKGFGLGLSVTKLVVELHGGRLKIASEENKGTVVTILLPVPAQ